MTDSGRTSRNDAPPDLKLLVQRFENALANYWSKDASPTASDAILNRLMEVVTAKRTDLMQALARATVSEIEGICDYKAVAIFFAEEVFKLLPYRRVHSLSREIWHEPEETDVEGTRCVAFLIAEELVENHPEHSTWYRHRDPAKHAKPYIPGAIVP